MSPQNHAQYIARFRYCISAFSILQSKAKSSILAPVKLFLPKEESHRRNERQLTDEQVDKLLAAIKGLSLYVFVMIGLYAGLRREEILALK